PDPYTLPLHDALPISATGRPARAAGIAEAGRGATVGRSTLPDVRDAQPARGPRLRAMRRLPRPLPRRGRAGRRRTRLPDVRGGRSEEHTSELQSRSEL